MAGDGEVGDGGEAVIYEIIYEIKIINNNKRMENPGTFDNFSFLPSCSAQHRELLSDAQCKSLAELKPRHLRRPFSAVSTLPVTKT